MIYRNIYLKLKDLHIMIYRNIYLKLAYIL